MKKYIIFLVALFFANITFGQSVEQAIADVNALLQKNIKEIDRGEIKFNKKTKNFEVALSDGHNGNYVNIFPINKIKSIEASSSRRKPPVMIYTFGEDVTMKGKKTNTRKINRCRLFLKTREDAAIAKRKLDYVIDLIKTEEQRTIEAENKKIKKEYEKIAGDFSPLIGEYKGHPFILGKGVNKKNKVKAQLTKDYHLTISEDFDGLWVKQFEGKVIPQKIKLSKNNTLAYYFKPENPKSDFSKIEISQAGDLLQSMSDFGNIAISYDKKDGSTNYFLVNKPTSIAQNARATSSNANTFPKDAKPLIYTGTTDENTFGNFQVEWYPAKGQGLLGYKNVANRFRIKKNGNNFRIMEMSKNSIQSVDFSYKDGKIKVVSIGTGSDFFRSKSYGLKNQSGTVANDKEFLIALGNAYYNLFKIRFRPKGDYTLTLYENTKGKGIYFFMSRNKNGAYAGELLNSKAHGKGILYYVESRHEGTFEQDKKNGMFNLYGKNKVSEEGRFVNNIREGIWKARNSDGDTFNITYKNGKEVNSVITNRGAENKQIITHAKEVIFQLKSYRDSYDRMREEVITCQERVSKIKGYDLADAKSCYYQLKYRVSGFPAGIRAAQTEMRKAIKSAERTGCEKTITALKNANKELEIAEVKFENAYDTYENLKNASSKTSLSSYLEKGDRFTVDGVNIVAKVINQINSTPKCFARTNSSSSNSTTSTSTSSNSSTFSSSTNKYAGVGFKVRGKEGFFRASYPKKGWAASKAGVRESDRIFEIDGKKLGKNLSQREVESMLSGLKGTSVKVKFGQWDKPELAKEYILIRGEGGKAERVNQSNTSSATASNTPKENAKKVFKIRPFSGNYAGDDLVNLLGREKDDPVIQKWLKDSKYSFNNSPDAVCDPCMYFSKKYGTTLKFGNNKLERISILGNKPFDIKLPLDTKLGASVDAFNPKSKGYSKTSYDEWSKQQGDVLYSIYISNRPKKIRGISIEIK